MELMQSSRNKQELKRIKKGLAMRQTEIPPVIAPISGRAVQLVETHALSHSMQLDDALIAATALHHGLTVLTANTKHFSAIDGLRLEAFQP